MNFSTLGISLCSTEEPSFLGIFDLTTAPHLLYYSYIPIALAVLLTGLFVYFNGKKSLQVRLLLAVAVSFSFWVINILAQWVVSYNTILMFAWQLTAMIEVLLYLFVAYFAYVFFFRKDIPFWCKLMFSFIITTVLILTPTTYNIVSYDLVNCEGHTGLLWSILYALEPALIVITVALGIIARRAEIDLAYRRQILLLTIGVGIFLSTFFLSNYYGELTKVYEFNFWGPLGMFVFILLLGYMMVRFATFNVKLIGAQALVTATIILISSQYFFVRDAVNYILVSFTLLLTVLFGYFLVRSVQKEISQRERIELLARDLEVINKQQIVLIHFVTHQVKGFVAKSRNIFSMMRDGDFGPVPEAMRPMIEEGFNSDTKGVATIQEILNAANIKSGKVTYATIPVDLCEVTKEIIGDLRPAAETKGLSLNFTCSETVPAIAGDRMQLLNAFKNLIDNSIKYAPKGSVDISLSKQEKSIRLTVKDEGIGITEEDMKNLFTEGGHGKDSQKINVDSTGFGLFIVKNIIEAHHGRVWAESEGEGKGATFTVELPISSTTA